MMEWGEREKEREREREGEGEGEGGREGEREREVGLTISREDQSGHSRVMRLYLPLHFSPGSAEKSDGSTLVAGSQQRGVWPKGALLTTSGRSHV